MTTETLSLLGFGLTVILACFVWVLAINVYVKNRKEYLNITLALSMLFAGWWLLSGFIEKILPAPSDIFTLWTFRWAYAAGSLALFFYFLFLLGLYLGRPPRRKALFALSVTAIFTVVVSLSPWGIAAAEYTDGVLKSINGPLFLCLPLFVIFFGSGCIYLAIAKWRHAVGIDRARTNIILCSLVFFIPFIVLFTFALPAITGNDISNSYSFLAGAIPVSFTSYAIIRLRLLDVRIILRKTGVFLLNLVILTTPMAFLFLVLSSAHLSSAAEKSILFIAFVALISLAPFMWREVEKYSSRMFFSGLYDAAQLKDAAAAGFSSSPDLFQSIPMTLRELILPLGLDRLSILILPEIISEHGLLFECSRTEADSSTVSVDEEYTAPGWFFHIDTSIVVEELQRWPKSAREKSLGEKLSSSKISACIPIKTQTRTIGHFLAGEKTGKKALSATDIQCLEEVGGHLGLYVDNYSLSSELTVRVRELESVYEDLRAADEFKTEIIEIMEHEFRTPATLIRGFAQVLVDNWERLEEEDKLASFEGINYACLRFNNLSEQFSLLTKHQRGEVRTRVSLINLKQLVKDICEAYDLESRKRVMNLLEPDAFVFSDPEHLPTIIKNILSNALRFSPIEQPVLVQNGEEGNALYVLIKDFGNGIPIEEEENIFEPFVRLEDVLHHAQGAGLGLYIVRVLSSMLSIKIHVHSSPGEGTTFKLIIPVKD